MPLPSSPMIVERGYLDHWKTNTLRTLTGLPNAAELPLRLWEHCEQRMDDFIEDRDGLVIAGICRAPIDPKTLLTALIRCRWIEKKTGGFIVRGWRERQKGYFARILNGQKGGRPKKTIPETQPEPTNNLQVSESEPNPNQNPETGNLQGGKMRVEESRRDPKSPPPRERGEGRGEISEILTETANFLLSLCGGSGKKRRALSHEALEALARQSEALPLDPEEIAILTRWLSLPEDPQNPFLRAGSRPQDASRLAIRLFDELDRATAHFEKSQKKGAPRPEPLAPEGWQQAFVDIFGGEKGIKEDFFEFAPSIQQQLRDYLSA